MNILKIAKVLTLAPGSPIEAVGGIVRMVGAYTRTNNEHGTITIQDLGIEDDTGVLDVKIGNHEEIQASLVDEQAALYFVAHQKDNGTTTGLRIAEEEIAIEDETRMAKYLMVARSAVIMTDEEFSVWMGTKQPTAVPAQSTPAPAATIQVPVQARLSTTIKTALVDYVAAEIQGPAQAPTTQPNEPAKSASFMRVSQLTYERQLDAKGALAGERMAITISIDPGGKSADAVAAAKNFLSKHLPSPGVA